ncbi:MAG: hypothetical protein ACJA0M_001662 [Chitinophagales bacterium]|jgi:hypothetical protein
MAMASMSHKNSARKILLPSFIMSSIFLGLTISINAAVLSAQFFDPVDGSFDASHYLTDNAYGFFAATCCYYRACS